MNDWEYDMWWDAIQSMYEEDDYDDMDDWQGGRPTFRGNIENMEATKFFVRLTSEKKLQ